MADNWEDRLAPVASAPASTWEARLRAAVDTGPAPNPAQGGSTLQVLNPFGQNFNTGINIGEGTQNFLAGAGKKMTDIAKGLAQKVGGYSFADAAETAKRDAPLMATGAGQAGSLVGGIATALPLAAVPGINTLAGAALAGAGMGAIDPATGWGNLAANTGEGAVGGLGGNVVGRGLGAAYGLGKSVLTPFFESGQKGLAADLIRQFTPDARTALRNIAADGGELVPGSLPSAADAAQVPGLAQLLKQVKQTPGSDAQAAILAREQANNAARVAAARTVSGDPGQRAFFAADRNATANQLYGQARQTGIDPAALTPEALKNIAAFQARLPDSVLNEARQIAKMSGAPMTDATSLDGMHWTKMALDGLISKEAGPSGNSALLKAYTGLKSDLLAGMDALSPDYAAARKTFADMSKPINQMDVGQALADKLIPALNDFGGTGNLRAAGYADALRHGDATAQRVLGMPSATIGDVLGDTHMGTLNALGQDLARASNTKNLAAAGGSDTVQNALSQNIIKSTIGPLGLPSSMASNTLLATLLRPAQYAGSLAEPKVMDQLARMLLSPTETAAALKDLGPTKAKALAQELLKYSSGTGSALLTGATSGIGQ